MRRWPESPPCAPGCRPTCRPFDWVLGVQDLQLKGPGDYVVRDRATGVAYIYNGRRSGVSSPRVLGEGLGAYDLAG